MKENSGSQDAIWASYGGFNSIKFNNNKFTVNKIKITKDNLDELSKNLFLIYTGINKFSNTIEKDKISNLRSNIKYLSKIYELAKELEKNIYQMKNFNYIGSILNEYWNIKKKLSSKVSNVKIDEIYNESLSAGASGGKIIGSGGGVGKSPAELPFAQGVPCQPEPAATARGARALLRGIFWPCGPLRLASYFLRTSDSSLESRPRPRSACLVSGGRWRVLGVCAFVCTA